MTADSVISLGARWAVIDGDNAEALPSIPDCSVDAIVTDPPAGIAFMGKEWDHHKGGRDAWIAWLRGVMAECLRVLKPGGHALIWAIPRTSHWTMTAVEDAGFEIRDVVYHAFGQGFPKSLDVSKAIDKAAGAARPIVRERSYTLANEGGYSGGLNTSAPRSLSCEVTAPATPEAAQWEGWGTALKPAVEPWILARKPLDGTVAANVLKHGTGAINIDGCRVDGMARSPGSIRAKRSCAPNVDGAEVPCGTVPAPDPHPSGRFPAHLTLSHNPDCREVGTRSVRRNLIDGNVKTAATDAAPEWGTMAGSRSIGSIDETIPAWECSEGCAVAMLDAQSGAIATSKPGTVFRRTQKAADVYGDHTADVGREQVAYGDSGGASRFFYTAKASRSDREEGLAGMPAGPARTSMNTKNGKGDRFDGQSTPVRANIHPTVKPTDLMRWLVRLITPPGGIVLDPFTGSGSTGKAAALEGMRFIGVEREAEYAAIARARIAHAYEHGTKLARKQPLAKGVAFAPATISDPAAE